jgi:uncharacterized protein (DUF433 family)
VAHRYLRPVNDGQFLEFEYVSSDVGAGTDHVIAMIGRFQKLSQAVVPWSMIKESLLVFAMHESFVTTNSKVMHGAPCFAGTRVTVKTLFDHLEAGYGIDAFLDQFPTVRREQVIGLLELRAQKFASDQYSLQHDSHQSTPRS